MTTETLPETDDVVIELTSVPAYGSYLHLKGRIKHVDPTQARIAAYIRVHGGWWNKPYWDAPATTVAADGIFSVDITTGGNDEQASEIAVFLVPSEYYPPSVRGDGELPTELHEKALAQVTVSRSP